MWNLLKKKEMKSRLATSVSPWDRASAQSAFSMPGTIPYTEYDRMQGDSMIQTALTVKKLGVLATRYTISGDDPDRTTFVEDCFARMEGSVETILMGAMDAFAKGWSVQECLYVPDGDQMRLAAVQPKDPSTFGLELDEFGTMTGLRLEMPGEPAVSLPRGKFIIFRHRSRYGKPKGQSDLDAAYAHFLAKIDLLAAMKTHLETFASFKMLGKFGRSVTEEERDGLFRSLVNLSSGKAVVYPDDIEVTRVGGDRDATAGFIDAIDFHNREIARSILGQTLTTDEGRRLGSLAMGKVHLQVLLLQLASIRKELADTVMNEQVIRPLVELNFGPGPIPRFAFEDTVLDAFAKGAI